MTPPVPSARPALLALWPNPIFRRYTRARLRPAALGTSLLLSVLIGGFIFFISRTIGLNRGQLLPVDGERIALIPLLVFQAIIIFFLGTGQVAGGITGEADEGVLDYQRLAPMTPAAKVLGYLFGLPIREWVMFASTLPFTAWALWKGEVPLGSWLPVYMVVICSALLYHLTGLVAGTVVKNRRWAFLMSIGIIILLYTVIPQAAKFGLVYFKYLTLWPVFDENMADLMPRESGGIVRLGQSMMPDVRFYGLKFSEAVFTVFSQSVLGLTFFVMLWRRWRRGDSHLLGKAWAVGLFAWMQMLLLGNALPLIEPGLLFASRQFGRIFGQRFLRGENWTPGLPEAVFMVTIYGLVTMILLLVLSYIITPNVETQVRGLQRGRKLGWQRLPLFSDPASSFWFTGIMALTGAVGWTIFSRALIGSVWFPGHQMPGYTFAIFSLVLLGAGLAAQAVAEAWGGRYLFLAIVFLGVLPVMVGGILGSVSDRMVTPAAWLVGLSPAAAPGYAAMTLVPSADTPVMFARAVPRAFWFWQAISAGTTVWLMVRLRQTHRARRAAVLSSSGPDVAAGS